MDIHELQEKLHSLIISRQQIERKIEKFKQDHKKDFAEHNKNTYSEYECRTGHESGSFYRFVIVPKYCQKILSVDGLGGDRYLVTFEDGHSDTDRGNYIVAHGKTEEEAWSCF